MIAALELASFGARLTTLLAPALLPAGPAYVLPPMALHKRSKLSAQLNGGALAIGSEKECRNMVWLRSIIMFRAEAPVSTRKISRRVHADLALKLADAQCCRRRPPPLRPSLPLFVTVIILQVCFIHLIQHNKQWPGCVLPQLAATSNKALSPPPRQSTASAPGRQGRCGA